MSYIFSYAVASSFFGCRRTDRREHGKRTFARAPRAARERYLPISVAFLRSSPPPGSFRVARDPTEASPTSGHGHPRASSVKFARRLGLDGGAITIVVYDRGMPVSVN